MKRSAMGRTGSRALSIWSRMSTRQPPPPSPGKATAPWMPPPQAPYTAARPEEGTEAASASSPPPPNPQRVNRMAPRLSDLPWPGVETSKSVQISEVGTEVGVKYWSPPREEDPREGVVRSDFVWDEEGSASYQCSYEFNDGGRSVQRSSKAASGKWLSSLTDDVSFRTRELLPPDTVAYIELHMQFSCLHFGLGLWEASAFAPDRWIGHVHNSWGYYEDGRLGTRESYEYGRVFKAHDDVGVLLFSPKEHRDAKLLFMKNGEPAGDVITIPKSQQGWHFGLTMINYHAAGAKAVITRDPVHTELALRWLGKLENPDDVDFNDEKNEDDFITRDLIQPYCKNRWNPYHVCSPKCREASEYHYVSDDNLGKPMPSTDLPITPTWMMRANEPGNTGPHAKGSWRHSIGEYGERQYKTIAIDRFREGKRTNVRWKKRYWNTGNMSFA